MVISPIRFASVPVQRAFSRPVKREALDTYTPSVPLLPVPDTRQSTIYSCGAAALQAVLMYWGVEYREDELMEMLGTDPEQGTHPESIVRVARELGFEAELREGMTLEDLSRLVGEGVPVIVDCQAWREGDQPPWRDTWEDGHYMVVIGIDSENVYFEDPSALGSRGFIPRDEFLERWHDYEAGGRQFLQAGIVIRGARPEPPPAFIYVS